MRQLAAEGLIVSRQGSGSFICPRDRAENGSHPITVDQGAARAFKAAMDSLDQVHGQAVSAIWTMRERQQASECSAELIAKLRELAEVAANLQNEAVTRIVEREETPHAKGDDF
ncbi:DNA-binding FadR family transcriptional regulator [Actinomadura viridis]|uniref:DNA-binding FadR family transcriptional regulator n=2 Tax=Actinomadura viridis TaxID=58110 RepID=A0A931GMV6_9ACTN|nr:DNA-binding FadR family transcriptional regulator [Actinomadura viridis]